MCRFKSGIILKNRVEIAPGKDDSHSNLLEAMGITDDYLNAAKNICPGRTGSKKRRMVGKSGRAP